MNNETDIEGALCSFCDSSNLKKIIDFGSVALAGAFLLPREFDQEKKYPMRLCFCCDCFGVQIIDKVDPNILFSDYFYFSSSIGTLREHFEGYASEVTERFLNPPSGSVLEFGCNDGILLRPFADLGVNKVIGIDPAKNVVKTISDERIDVVNDFFTEDVADDIVAQHGQVDMVVANNVYAHIPDIQAVTRAVKRVLNSEGVFIFEVHYLANVIEDLQYDMIYHEHLYYYSLTSAIEHFKRYDLVVFDVKEVPIHGGSIRIHVAHKGSRHANSISRNVEAMSRREKEFGYSNYESYRDFVKRLEEKRAQLMTLLTELRGSGKSIAGYGALGRANTMIQYCGIDKSHIDFMIDDAPAKLGYYTPGSHFEIKASDILFGPDAPDFVLVFAWSFLPEIVKRSHEYIENGGKFITPLPNVEIV